jgi:hypothetical protein
MPPPGEHPWVRSIPFGASTGGDMRRSLPLAIALACGSLTLACSDTPTSPAGWEPAGSELRTARNPNSPGALVVRFEGALGLFFSGPDEQYSVLAGLTLANLAALCADEGFSFEPILGQDVIRPDGSVHEVTQGRNVTILVFEGAFADFCAAPPFAVGRGRWTNTDNDLFVSLNRTNSFGFRLRGGVTEPGGQRHHVLVKFHGLFSRQGAFRELTSDIKLN